VSQPDPTRPDDQRNTFFWTGTLGWIDDSPFLALHCCPITLAARGLPFDLHALGEPC
jgi:hypothetical protein